MHDRPRDPTQLAHVVGQIVTGELPNDKDDILDPPEPSIKVKGAKARAAPRLPSAGRRSPRGRPRRAGSRRHHAVDLSNSMVGLSMALASLMLLGGCDTTGVGRIADSEERDITGTYERWSWEYGVEGPENIYLVYKSVFDKEGYYYRYGIVTISYRRYQYDDENSRIRFSGDFRGGPIWTDRNWKAIRWYTKSTFCIINEECFLGK